VFHSGGHLRTISLDATERWHCRRSSPRSKRRTTTAGVVLLSLARSLGALASRRAALFRLRHADRAPADGRPGDRTERRFRRSQAYALDAGCGYGGTAFDLIGRIGGNWLGRTISPIQINRARKEALKRGVENRIRFELNSYDEPIDGQFDLAIAIESMVHSVNPSSTVANIARALKPGGIFILVDDMPIENFPPELAGDLEIVRKMWRCPVMPTERGWREAFEAAGLAIECSRDLSKLIYHRPVEEMNALIARDTRRASWLRWSGLRMIPEANIGGLMIERLAVHGALEYRVLRGRKQR
jgi:SAM-dependent methyltransferase